MVVNTEKTFQIASDLHIEYNNDDVPDPLDYITPSADYLILAGDIGSFYKLNQLKGFLEKLCTHFKLVLYIPGNQEYYYVKDQRRIHKDALLHAMYEFVTINNLYILNRDSVIIDGICISGCTLWTKPEIEIPKYIVKIPGINKEIYEKMHTEDLNYIKKVINYCQSNSLKLLVVTHHCPTFKVGYRKIDKISSLYMSHLDELLCSTKVNTWVCGHIHQNFDFMSENGTRVVGNQYGKPRDNIKDYSKSFTITL